MFVDSSEKIGTPPNNIKTPGEAPSLQCGQISSWFLLLWSTILPLSFEVASSTCESWASQDLKQKWL